MHGPPSSTAGSARAEYITSYTRDYYEEVGRLRPSRSVCIRPDKDWKCSIISQMVEIVLTCNFWEFFPQIKRGGGFYVQINKVKRFLYCIILSAIYGQKIARSFFYVSVESDGGSTTVYSVYWNTPFTINLLQ